MSQADHAAKETVGHPSTAEVRLRSLNGHARPRQEDPPGGVVGPYHPTELERTRRGSIGHSAGTYIDPAAGELTFREQGENWIKG
jgi:hypothetical protein